ncbi:hypothetical protein IF2G_09613 [Cordyceps javanica]|nr:hypothetical protein IF2G_09613 [Cordyceps javanica]
MPFSQLEMVTLSFAICGIMIYIINIHKPQGIDRATNISLRDHRYRAAKQTHDSLWAILSNRRKDVPHKIESKSDPPRIPNDSLPADKSTNIVHPVVYPLAGVSAIFGLIHAIAWPFEFPTTEEKLLWRTATIVSAVCPIFALLSIPIAQSTESAGKPELFIIQSLRLLQEYRWHYPRNYPVNEAIEALQIIFRGIVQDGEDGAWRLLHYSLIFAVDSADAGLFLRDVEDFLLLSGRYQNLYSTPINKPGDDQVRDPGRRLELHDDEKGVSSKALNEPGNDQGTDRRRDRKKLELHDDEEFKRNFARLVKVLYRTDRKRLRQEARTDMWPRKSKYHRIWNDLILYGTSVLYCISRFVLLGVAFSSLRKMPGKVYVAIDWTSYLPFFGGRG